MTDFTAQLSTGDTVTISSSTTTSNAIDMQGYILVQIIIPATFTGTTITFQTSPDGNTFYDIYNTNNTKLSATVTQGRAYGILPSDFSGVRFLKIVSSATEGSDRVITLVRRKI